MSLDRNRYPALMKFLPLPGERVGVREGVSSALNYYGLGSQRDAGAAHYESLSRSRWSCLKQRRGELLRVEGLKIIRLLADADEFDRQAEFLLNGNDHAALAGAVEFGDDQAR